MTNKAKKIKKPVFANNITDEVAVDLVSELKRGKTRFVSGTSQHGYYPWHSSDSRMLNYNRRWCPSCSFEPMVTKGDDGKSLKYALCRSCGHKENI
jgi:hypothetical protein